MKIQVTAAVASAILGISSAAHATILIRNDFSQVNVAYDGSIGVTNLDSSPVLPAQAPGGGRFDPPWQNFSGIEGGPGQSFAWQRNIGDSYDHDNDPSTPNIAIPGGIEINGWDQSYPGILVITVTAPEDIPAGQGVIKFWAAFRQSITGGQVQIANITQGIDALPPTTILDHGIIVDEGGTEWDFRKEWKYNEFSTITPISAGDELQVIFTSGTEIGDAGLELTDLTFETVVPEPTSIGLVAMCAGVLLRRRRH
jgi:hypothetical protein